MHELPVSISFPGDEVVRGLCGDRRVFVFFQFWEAFLRVVDSVHVEHEIDHPVGVPPLVVVPRHELDEVLRQLDARSGVEDAGAAVADEVGGHDSVLGVPHDAEELAAGRGCVLDGLANRRVRRALLDAHGQVHHRHVLRGNAERHAGELTVELGQHLAHSLGGASGRGDDVGTRAAASAPVLHGRPIHRLLRGGGGVHGRHQPLHDAVVVVDDLGQRRRGGRSTAALSHHITDTVIWGEISSYRALYVRVEMRCGFLIG
mmetsp:Transcript_6855/g.10580  ORF Transcript_6855/g.10580 Transcript_6855/m.10580 type:complete len:260 (+) Transcript_6855:495-1274(+)